MKGSFALVTGIHWGAVVLYVVATVMVVVGQYFQKPQLARRGLQVAVPGLVLHGAGLLIWWRMVGHGPYIDRFEVLSSNAWILLAAFLVFTIPFPRLVTAGVVVLPASFILVALGLFFSPEMKTLPPTFRSVWLVLHIIFYKIAFSAIIIAFAFSLFYLLIRRGRLQKLAKSLPDLEGIDSYAYRFAGLGFTFWAIGMLAGSIWAYQSWGTFWNWDPVQTWSLVTWAVFGIYLHLRRFFAWQGERASWLFVVCFALTLVSLFLTPLFESSIHAEYFK
ncbi:cytochrome c biogenesis protein ResC [Geomonas silvestris]|uniref:Cytochrome c biogenesis protein ResC n=1 Tax=Geomonas silvestris TaxID=2740184 RepID=A0A6V8MLQ8_9BACT|nr:cytochrome c biogenesis protein CcsA [Geomonas silvestris]GFO60936.1 cytochrome c biogenesis protein ResC [Geomonas silvestris]